MSLTKEEQIAFETNEKVFSSDLRKNEVASYYTEWSQDGVYDEHLGPNNYNGPEQVAKCVADQIMDADRATVKILDVAAGTGRVGTQLHKLGFRNIDALDPAEGMLAVARDLGVYKKLMTQFIALDTPVPCEDGAYDAVVCSGGFGDGHIPASALEEFTRIGRSGGLICLVMRVKWFDGTTKYSETIRDVIEELETDGRWKMVKKEIFQGYICHKEGILLNFIVNEI